MGGLSKEYANSSGTRLVIEIKLLEGKDLKGWSKRVKISTVFVHDVNFLTYLPRQKKFEFVSDLEIRISSLNQKFKYFWLALCRGGLEVLAFDFFD
jgi:hypothetical protein